MLNTINICKIHFALSILKRQSKYNLGVLKICFSLQHCFTWSSFYHYMDFIVILYGSLSAVPLIMSMTKRRPHSIDPHCVVKERNYVMCPPLCIERNAENLSLIQRCEVCSVSLGSQVLTSQQTQRKPGSIPLAS